MTGTQLIALERRSQKRKHKRTVAYDKKANNNFQFPDAVTKLLIRKSDVKPDTNLEAPEGWKKETWEHMLNKEYSERVIIAGALLAAEIDRIRS